MTTLIVGVGDLAVSNIPGDLIRTFGLGSCVGVVAVDTAAGVTGMLHVVLPESSINPARAVASPAYFADTGVPALIKAMEALGARNSRRWIVKLVGGAKVLTAEGCDALDIGKRNILAVKKCLWKVGLAPLAEDVGKTHSRTVTIAVGSQSVTVANQQVGNITI
jgi:chemotaxis protein CheD